MDDASNPTRPSLFQTWAAVLLSMTSGREATPAPRPEAADAPRAEPASAEAPDSS